MRAVEAKALHLGGDETADVDPDKECYPAGQGVGAIDELVLPANSCDESSRKPSGRCSGPHRMPDRLVVVGGDAAGMTAASSGPPAQPESELEVVAFERGGFTSYSACGLPYYVAGEIDDIETSIARSPEEHRANGIDVRIASGSHGDRPDNER